MPPNHETGRSFSPVSPKIPSSLFPPAYRAFGLLSTMRCPGRSYAPVTPFTPRLSGAISTPSFGLDFVGGSSYPRIPDAPCGSTYDFGSTPVTVTVSHEFTITNSGAAPLNITGFFITGTGFSILSSPPSVIGIGDSATFEIQFDAPTVDEFTGELTIESNSDQSPCIITLTGEAIGVVVSGVTYQGNFIWYGFFPYDYDPASAIVPDRYLTRTAAGNNTQLTGYFSPDVVYGTIDNTFSGTQTIDETNGSQSGFMQRRSVFAQGKYCRGSSYADVTSLTLTDQTTQALDNLAYDNTFVTGSGIVTRLRRAWDGGRSAGGVTTYCGISINGVVGDKFYEILDVPMTLEQAALNGGATTIPVTYDSEPTAFNANTGAMAGRVTQLNFTSPVVNPSGYYLIQVHLTKTPSGGGPAVVYSQYIAVNEGAMGALNYDYVVPMEVGYVIAVTSVDVTTLTEASDEFTEQQDFWYSGQSLNWTPTPTWAETPFFGMLAPYTMCACDWEDYPPGLVGVPITTDASGYYWAGNATFRSVNGSEASDDFENYAVGTVLVLDKGLGFASIGRMILFDNNPANDDFESYVTGTITALNWETGDLPFNCWSADGTFASLDNLLASDDFESYAVGVITVLNGGSGWFANGSFAVFP